MKGLRAFTLMLTLIFCSVAAMAQSKADQLYNEGLRYQQTMTVQAQNNAISKFKKAKIAYDSADKKAKCDQAIAVSNNIIKSLSGKGNSNNNNNTGNNGGSGKDKKNDKTNTTTTTIVKAEPTLEVDRSQFEFPPSGGTIRINVKTNQSSWDVKVDEAYGGTPFVSVKKEASYVSISVPDNNSAAQRSQNVAITAGGLTRTVSIRQEGNPIHLEVLKGDKAFIMKAKGGEKKIEIGCDAKTAYSNNSNLNWYVAEKPEWVLISAAEKKEKTGVLKTVQSGLNKVGNAVGISSGEQEVSANVTVSEVKIKVAKNTSSANRRGVVVLSSGGATVSIEITQDGK